MASTSTPQPRGPEPERSEVALGRLGDFVGFRLRRVQNQLSRKFAAANADLGLRSGLFSSLAIVAANPGISQSELSGAVGLDKSVTVTIIDELEKYGWAERRRSAEDRRRHALYVTPEGDRQLDRLFARMEEVEGAVLHQLSDAEHQMLNDVLDRMYDAVVREL
ncbi:MarR family winged helix-turn-helix transcriptional regulator [Novosphingobium piscinae]|uniref:Winged helix-turn-helix transcriptional regulator n=1 Tax=Novosphingobium piscinae TaxID=1507448 RepID=A0A7X1KND1_9SPHN|nr:MarR family winged helix-turn-helix transcriptional regulator [Novosphingobium piscinae]MBC2667571.1 winged helix-turn-helix transcriptional regulator [Novosphingobium piscinae]